MQAIFFGSLYTVMNHLIDAEKLAHKVITYLRELTGCIPLISAVAALVHRQSLTVFQVRDPPLSC